jgi:hypothetical protein
MSLEQLNQQTILKRVNTLEREMEYLKRDILRQWTASPRVVRRKPSLFGSVQSGDITEEMIDDARKSIFRPTLDI